MKSPRPRAGGQFEGNSLERGVCPGSNLSSYLKRCRLLKTLANGK